MKNPILKKVLFVLLLLIVSVFSNGQYAVFFALWIFTTLLLFAVRTLPRGKGFLLAFIGIAVGYYIGFDVVPFLPVTVSILITIIFSLFASLPYLLDSFFTKKRNSFLSTLVFPCSAVLFEYGYHLINQYGSWGHFAYTQQSQHLLLQSVSVFGMGYITFLITWFAAVSNWVYEQRNNWGQVKKGVLIYILVPGLTSIYGGYRVHFLKSDAETIRIASISAPDSLSVMIDLQGLNNATTVQDVKSVTRKNTAKLNNYLFETSITEAEAGAEIVFWAEGNGVLLKEDENELYQKAGQIASTQNIFLGLGVAVIDPKNSKYLENKFVLFDKTGTMVLDYWKGISVPGAETPISNNKATGILKTETEYGTIAGVICFDMDFPQYLKAATGVDILFAPSNDYKEIAHMHADMAKFRALEQGFNLVRQASLGLSTGTDYTGKVISEMNHFTDSGKVMITHLPTKGTKTIYARIGDSFIVFCLVLLLVVILVLRKKTVKI